MTWKSSLSFMIQYLKVCKMLSKTLIIMIQGLSQKFEWYFFQKNMPGQINYCFNSTQISGDFTSSGITASFAHLQYSSLAKYP